jgi:hypothetical protein
MREEEQKKTVHKDRECIHCKRFFNCTGKPIGVKACLFFEERKKKDGE